jgi:hypothetical protein
VSPTADKPEGGGLKLSSLTRIGLLIALSLVFLNLRQAFSFMDLIFYLLASLPVAFAYIKGGVKEAFFVYLGTCLIGMLRPGPVYAWPFILCWGYYPIVKAYIEKSSTKLSGAKGLRRQIVLKSFYFIIVALVFYGILSKFFAPQLGASLSRMVEKAPALSKMGPGLISLFLGLCFLLICHLYDFCLSLLIERLGRLPL